ncbi:transporter substrate-binding domain-containing protein [Pseudohalocynthiibacter aestuariivivens]|uniref:Transporter substrate-binding domain-containing protein n=1 Tax=Roseovarius pelagicus TaxID=2980108 RepID=A0ABY6DB10_9RHOB|nr:MULTISPECIES: transporter substrate-binding domain-containing protein [Rhodobacterales]QIE45719.1 transporter substrate-binding domain-containing protein [Pseudohalocynthiibacter aestuariivivens]UXX82353.1 transporter substrate-binding domain-containing protein [Roseovarius pelagicus]
MKTQESWKIGILFSTSGVTSIIEVSQLNGTLLAIDEINARGGVRGRPIEPVSYNPGSVVSNYGDMAEKLIVEDRITALFGCYMSSSRKEVLPVVERRNALFFYPTLYEGFEYSPNVIYGGATPNQNSVPLANHLINTYGKRIFFVGSDYIYPRESNRVMRNVLRQGGGEVLDERYYGFDVDEAGLAEVAREIVAMKPDAIFSTVVGQMCIDFYRAYHAAGGDGRVCPIASLTTNEAEIAAIGPEASVGHITAAPYFRSINSPANRKFLKAYKQKFGSVRDVTSCCEAAYCQMHIFANALEEVGDMDTDRLHEALLGATFDAPQGHIKIDPDNTHTYLQSRIAHVDESGEFVIENKVRRALKPDPYLVYPQIHDWSFRPQKVIKSTE